MITTYNFKTKEEPGTAGCVRGTYRDERNGIECVNPTVDMECYGNYIEYLNGTRNKWQSYGYLDLGLMPVVMFPSFMLNSPLRSYIVNILSEAKIRCWSMPPVSLMYKECKIADEDIWVYRQDVALALGVEESQVNFKNLLLGGR